MTSDRSGFNVEGGNSEVIAVKNLGLTRLERRHSEADRLNGESEETRREVKVSAGSIGGWDAGQDSMIDNRPYPQAPRI